MPDYSPVVAEWEAVRERRPALREALGFWTPILEGWARCKVVSPEPLEWSDDACRRSWEEGRPLLRDARPAIDREMAEALLGPVMERLSAHGAEAALAFHRFAEAWDRGEIGPDSLFPCLEPSPVITLEARFGLGRRLGAFLPLAAMRPALETWFERTRSVPDGVWARGICPWCGGFASYGDLGEDGRRRLSCHVCGGAWAAPRL